MSTRPGEDVERVSEALLRIRDLTLESLKRILPARVKAAMFSGVIRIITMWRLLRRQDSKFVTGYLGGMKGIEIGAASHNQFYLDALNVDRYPDDQTVYKQAERSRSGSVARVDVVAPGDELPFAESSYDFVFSSHVIEHFPDPIKALYEWVRVARLYVVAVVPHRDRTFEADLPLTSVEELTRRHREGFISEEDKHWSVWSCESFVEMCETIGLSVIDRQDPDDKVGNGFTVVIDAAAGIGVPTASLET
jgi:SAM-dependent methyltransferase